MSDTISRQAAIDIERSSTVDTNPEHFKAHQKFNKLRFYRAAIKWLWQHRTEPSNRNKWRRMMREVQE